MDSLQKMRNKRCKLGAEGPGRRERLSRYPVVRRKTRFPGPAPGPAVARVTTGSGAFLVPGGEWCAERVIRARDPTLAEA